MKGNIYEIINNSYGFISVQTGKPKERVFFHKNDLTNCSIRQLDDGDAVEFEIVDGRNGLPKAVKVRKIYQATEQSLVSNPGINPNVILDHFNNDEKQIVNFLSKHFYVTSGGSEFQIGESTYRYCLIKPTDYFNKNWLFCT